MFLSKLQNSSRSPEVSLAEPWGSVRSTLRTYGLDDCHGPSPILHDTVPLFVYIGQLLRHCIFIYSNAN